MSESRIYARPVYLRSVLYTASSVTSSSAIAKRPRDASCLSVASFVASIVQYLERSFFYPPVAR